MKVPINQKFIENTRIKFKKAARRKDEKYLIVFCDVRRKDVEKFIHAIEEKNQGFMLLDI